MARTLNEQLLQEAGLADQAPERQKPRRSLLARILRVVFYTRLGIWLVILAVLVLAMVFPWPGDARTVFYDLAALAAVIWLGTRWRRYRHERTHEPRR